jgi:hypothetical protein
MKEASGYFKLAANQGDAEAIKLLAYIFNVGVQVQVTGLASTSGLNGLIGTVTKPLGNGRAEIVLQGQSKPYSIRYMNFSFP